MPLLSQVCQYTARLTLHTFSSYRHVGPSPPHQSLPSSDAKSDEKRDFKVSGSSSDSWSSLKGDPGRLKGKFLAIFDWLYKPYPLLIGATCHQIEWNCLSQSNYSLAKSATEMLNSAIAGKEINRKTPVLPLSWLFAFQVREATTVDAPFFQPDNATKPRISQSINGINCRRLLLSKSSCYQTSLHQRHHNKWYII